MGDGRFLVDIIPSRYDRCVSLVAPISQRVGRWTGPCLVLAAGLFAASSPRAGEADILAAEASCDANRVCRFSVTLRHADAGWDHYADGWQVLSEDGEVLHVRVLRHPHVKEQPFTRELRGAKIPAEIRRVRIRAHDSVHGHGGAEVVVELPDGD